MNRRLPILAALALTALVSATASAAAAPVAAPHGSAGAASAAAPAAAGPLTGLSPARDFAPREVVVKFRGQRFGRAVQLGPRVGVRRAAAALRRNPRVAYAAPNYIATASARKSTVELPIPNDPGPLSATDPPVPGGWVLKQWNFLPWEGVATPELPISPGGIDAVGAWENLIEANRPGGAGITVAVLDTGIAYRSMGRFQRSPDFNFGQFAKGYDFVADDRFPLDQNGHGTHVAGTIGEKTGNGVGLTGLAYGARLMPVRVLDRRGAGRADHIARGIRFAVAGGADVINMSFNFECGRRVPGVEEELRRAYRRGVVTVASIGNLGSEQCVSPPATGPHVIGVGGTTEGGCLGKYSLAGKWVDVVAPGGGLPADGCPSVSSRPIYQVTFMGRNPARFGQPGDYVGTSMAAAHVSGVAALVLANSAQLGASPRAPVDWVRRRLQQTARSLGLPATQQGAGLIDAAAATTGP